MAIIALAYVSRAAQDFDVPALQTLAKLAAEKNSRLAVTGYLSFRQGVFLQYLEGEQQVIEELMNTISADERHQVVRQIQLGELDDRVFADWSMRFLSASDFAEIGLADVLEGVMLTMVSEAFDREAAQRTVLRLVEKIAGQRNRLRRRL
jgi:hypothetical protein